MPKPPNYSCVDCDFGAETYDEVAVHMQKEKHGEIAIGDPGNKIFIVRQNGGKRKEISYVDVDGANMEEFVNVPVKQFNRGERVRVTVEEWN